MMRFARILCGLLLLLPAHLAAQLVPYGTFTSHTDGQTVADPNITITWHGCSTAAQTSFLTRVNGVNKTTTQSNGQQCPDYSVGKNYSASGTLVNGANTLYLRVCDVNGCGENTITVYHLVPAISVTPDGGTAPSVPQRTTGSYGFTVKNTGGLSATAVFTPTCSGAISSCSVSPASASLGAGDSATATVSYTGASVGSGTATLHAQYNEYPATSNDGFVNVTVTENPIWGVTVTPVNASQTVTAGTAFIRFDVANTSQYTQTSSDFALTPTVSGSVGSCTVSSPVTLYPGDPPTRVTANCTISGSGSGGSVTLKAETSSPASFSAQGTTNVTVSPTYNVSLTAVASKTEPARTTSDSVIYTVTNNSQNSGAILFSFSRTCSLVTTCGDPIGGVSVPEGSSRNVTFPYLVSLSGTSGQLSLTANSVAPAVTRVVDIATTPDYVISVSSASSQTLPAGATSGSTSYTITNTSANSASSVVVNLGASCGAGIASACSPSVGQVTIAQGAQATPSVSYNVSLTGVSGSATLTASPGSPAFTAKSSTTTINATPSYSVSVTPPASSTLPAQTTSGNGTFTIQNTSTNSPGPITFTLTAPCTGIASCTASQGTMQLDQGAWNQKAVAYNVSLSGTSGSVALAASSASPSIAPVTGTATLTATPSYSVSVTPVTSSLTLPAGTTSGSRTYTIQNTSTNIGADINFTLTASCAGIASCAASQGTMLLAQGASNTKDVAYGVSLTGTTGAVALAASSASPSIPAVTGTTTLTATPAYSVSVTPVTSTVILPAGTTSGSRTFTIQNTSTNSSDSIAFSLNATCLRIASCPVGQGTTKLPQGASSTKQVDYAVSLSDSTGTVALSASSGSPILGPVTGTTTLTATPYYSIAVIPATGSALVGLGTANTYPVTIQNQSTNSGGPITASLGNPVCSGNVVSACSVPANSAAIAQGAQTAPITLNYTAHANGTESLALNASGTAPGATVHVTNASLAVTVASSGTLTMATATQNPRTTMDKSSCLTIAAGQNAAYECGDLRLVHPLPATITMDRSRGPALIYNSRHANPSALLAADVNYTGPAPAILRATVTVTGQTAIIKDFPWSTSCQAQACRVVVPIPTTQATGLYPTTIQIKAINGATTYATSSTLTDTVLVVNRAASPFGAGWWVDGLESLLTLSSTKMLWVGGDGSSRVYTKTADATVYTVSPAFDRPDTLKKIGSGQPIWRRYLGDSSYVEFNSSGQHIRTKNSLGWNTKFVYTGALLDSIVLPVPVGSTQKRAYKFRYTSSLLDSVTAPKAAFARTTRMARTGAKVSSITDPDGLAIAFGYDASNRITTRRNKLGDTTYFQYDDGGALKQVKLSTARTDGAGAAITTNFRAAETRSAYSPTDVPTLLAKAYTQLDGPRVDVGDTTNFMVNRWGAPDTAIDATGQRTRMTRGNASFPALVTKVVMPNNFETRAYFNARALIDSTVAVNPYGTGANAVTKFVWNTVWTHVDSVIGPTGERRRTFYRSTVPLVDSMRTGTNVLRRVKFTYTADNQVRSVTEPAGLPDSIAYDTLGNAKRTWTPLGRSASTPYFIEHFTDGIGRDTLVVHPISGDTTGKTRILFNAADQVVQTVDSGPARPYSFSNNSPYTPDTSAITPLVRTDSSGYDAEGNLVYKRAISTPWSDAATTEQLTYDAAGRLRKRLIGSGPDSMVYDPAGNLVSARYRSGLWVSQTYDTLNRLVQQLVPERVYPSSRCVGYSPGPISGSGGCFMIFPYNPNAGDSLRIATDTAKFTYDTFGNITQATNRYARITRTYFPGGALQSDSTAIGVYTSPLTDGTKRGQKYMYDLSGKRTSMQWHLGTTGYSYNDFGALDTVTDPNSNHYHIAYALDGHVDSLVLGTGVTEKRGYDADGRLISKNRVSSYAGMGTLVTDALDYDRMNRVIHSVEQNHGAVADETWITYDGLGGVISSEQGSAYGTNIQEFRNDALGNVLYRRSHRTAGTNDAPFVNQYSPVGEMLTSFSNLSNPSGQHELGDTLKQNFAGGGQLNREDRLVRGPNTGAVSLELASKHYYGADDKLMAVQRYVVLANGTVHAGTWEEYWYDALGRRVLTRAARDSSKYDASTSGPLCAFPSLCASFKERVWWDGNQALVEERTPEGYANDVSNSGLVGNIHGLTLDEPLAVMSDQTRIINYNWRGLGESSVFTNGQAGDNSLGNPATEIDWPAATQAETYFTPGPGSGGSGNPKKWMGTFVANGQGTTGMLYRRNRYFNPNGGQFTQADPIGIAGGMNAFGFAGGDPVTYSDPFGLLDCDREHMDECSAKDKWQNFVAGLGALASGDLEDKGPGWRTGFMLSEIGLMFGMRAPVGQGVAGVSAAAQATAVVADALMPDGVAIGRAGANVAIRELSGGAGEASEMFSRLSQGGARVKSNYPGTLMRLPNGGTVGMRTVMSRSPGTAVTIDVNIPGVPIEKLKFNP